MNGAAHRVDQPDPVEFEAYLADRQDLCRLAQGIETVAPAATPDLKIWLDHLLEPGDLRRLPALDIEKRLEKAATQLRRAWLEAVHGVGDALQKSPRRDQVARTRTGQRIDFGYERDLQPVELEARCRASAPGAEGWCTEHVLLSSGQSALTAMLLALGERAAGNQPLRVLHIGGYFESRDLLGVLDRRLCCHRRMAAVPQPGDPVEADVVLVEPVFCDGGLAALDLERLVEWLAGRAVKPAAVIFDTTIAGIAFPLVPLLGALRAAGLPLVIALRSGLKLDQAGMELANVGIVSAYAPRHGLRVEQGLAERLRRIRTLIGANLSLDEVAALEAPWFLSADDLRRHSIAVFGANAALAEAVPKGGGLFDRVSHPHRDTPMQAWAEAPFCVFRLASDEVEDYRLLEHSIAMEAVRRGLLFDLGGSFGFRGHRFEAVIPAPGQGGPFLRIAMGARGGRSREGIVAMMRDFAALSGIEALRHRTARAA